jgi:cobalt-zinc-cadmium efflux system outer membrane protein
MLLVLTLLLAPARARDLTFEDAVRTALTQGPDARGVRAAADATRAEARAFAAWQGNPQLDVERRPDETALTLSVPLEIAGQPLARRRAADLTATAATLREQAARANVGIDAGLAYLDAVRARERATLARATVALAERTRAAAERRRAAGEASPGEAALQAAQAAQALEASLTHAREALERAARLGALLGEDEPPDVGDWPSVPAPPALEPADLPQVRAAATDAAAATERTRAARLERVPDLQVRAGWGLAGNVGPIYGATLSLPVLAPGIAAAKAALADAQRALAASERARLDADATHAALVAELHVAEQVAAAWTIPDLDAALEAVVRRYEAGETGFAALLAEREAAVSALQARIEARWRLERARLALWAFAGRLPPSLAAP